MPREKTKPVRRIFSHEQDAISANLAGEDIGIGDDEAVVFETDASSRKRTLTPESVSDDDGMQDEPPTSVWGERPVMQAPLVYTKTFSVMDDNTSDDALIDGVSSYICAGHVGFCPIDVFEKLHPQCIALSKLGNFGFLRTLDDSGSYELYGVVYKTKIAKEIEAHGQLLSFKIRRDTSTSSYHLYVFLKVPNYYTFECFAWAFGCDEIISFLQKSTGGDEFESIYNEDKFVDIEYIRAKKTKVNMEKNSFLLQNLMDFLCDRSVRATDKYSALNLLATAGELKSAGITTELRSYQLRGVLWILEREMNVSLPVDILSFTGVSSCTIASSNSNLPEYKMSHILSALKNVSCDGWVRLKSSSPENYDFWFNILSGLVSISLPSPMPLITGGILADMMGIGKTLQILSAVALQPRAQIEYNQAVSSSLPNSRIRLIPSFDLSMSNIIASVFPSIGKKYFDTETDVPTENICFCKRSSFHQNVDVCWITCSYCKKGRHLKCCGFTSINEITDPSHFVCFSCICSKLYTSAPTLKLQAGTLIIVPSTLLSQWQQQVKEHTNGSLSVFVYSGIKAIEKYVSDEKFLVRKKVASTSISPNKLGFVEKIDTFFDIHPVKLMTYDIVITSFEVLKNELDRTISPYVIHDDVWSERTVQTNFRKPKKFDIYPSPLTCLNWYRIVLDEAQEVQGAKTSSLFRMTMQLIGKHKWCVSGTPLGRGEVEDLVNIFAFFRQEPFASMRWGKLLSRPTSVGGSTFLSMLHNMLAVLTLRRTHQVVEAELGLKPQSTRTKYLEFSSIEKHNYEKKERDLRNDHIILREHAVTILRKICCHPQLVDSRLGWDNIMSMNDVCFKLIEESRRNCEDKQREMIYYYNSFAGICMILARLAENGNYFDFEKFDCIMKAFDSLITVCSSYERNRVVCPIISAIALSGNLYSGNEINSLSFRGDKADILWIRKPTMSSSIKFLDAIHLQPYTSTQKVEFNLDADQERSMISARDIFDEELYAKVEFAGSLGRRVKKLVSNFSVDSFLKTNSIFSVPTEDVCLVFPYEISLQISVSGTSGTFSTVKRMKVPCPVYVDGENKISVRDILFSCDKIVSSYRSKIWRLTVESFHTSVLLVRTLDLDVVGTEKFMVSVVPFKTVVLNKVESARLKTIYPLFVEMYDSSFEVDLFQEIHSKEKLREVASLALSLNCEVETVRTHIRSLYSLMSIEFAPDLTDDTSLLTILDEQISGLKSLEVQSAQSRQFDVMQKLSDANSQLMALLQDEIVGYGSEVRNDWWIPILQSLSRNEIDIRRLESELLSQVVRVVYANEAAYLSTSFDLTNVRTAGGLIYIMSTASSELFSKRSKLISMINGLPTEPTAAAVKETGNCLQCCKEFGKTGPICAHCRLNEQLKDYSSCLHSYKKRVQVLKMNERFPNKAAGRSFSEHQVDENELQTAERYRVDGIVIMLNRVILNFLEKNQKWFQDLDVQFFLGIGKKAISVFEHFQKEIIYFNAVWKRHLEVLFVHDEVSMVTSSLTLVSPVEWELMDEALRRSAILESEVVNKYASLQEDCLIAESDLKSAVSELTFRKNLEHSKRQSFTNEENQELCGICLDPLVEDVCILPCGQSYHVECVNHWLRSHGKCPVCKRRTKPSDLQMVNRETRESNIIINGEWGSKVDALVSDILELIRSTDEKAIVFSQWPDMFFVLFTAFQKNNIRFAICRSKADFSMFGPLGNFKSDPSVRVLILLLQHGCHGITITEASHVFLFEPIMNPQQEAQAINRVHRIGQIRPTVVHKYVINGTIEQRIHNLTENIFEKAGGMNNILSAISSDSKIYKDDMSALTSDQFNYLLGAASSSSAATIDCTESTEVN